MKVWASVHKNHKAVRRISAQSELTDASEALMDCLEQVYKTLDVAEPVWVKKHAIELNRYHRVKFLPSDFIEAVDFDYLEIEFSTL